MAENESNLAAGAKGIRDTIKWLIASFAAPLALLVGTSPLAKLGALDRSKAEVAIAAGGTALAVVIYAIKLATDLLVSRPLLLADVMSNDDIRSFIDEYHEDLLPVGEGTLCGFYAEHRDLGKKLRDPNAPTTPDDLKDYQEGRRVVDKLLEFANYERLRRQFEAIRLKFVILAIIGAVAAVTFAWAAGNAAPVWPD